MPWARDAYAFYPRVNDDAHQLGDIGMMAADWNIDGRVYLSGTGRGMLCSN